MQVSGLWDNDMFMVYYRRQRNSDGKLATRLITAPHPHCKSLRATLFDELSTVLLVCALPPALRSQLVCSLDASSSPRSFEEHTSNTINSSTVDPKGY